MPHQAPTGQSFAGPKFQDCMSLLMARSTNGSVLTLTDQAAPADAENPYAEVRALSGMVEMGDADGLFLMPMGAGVAGTSTIFATRYDPVRTTAGLIGGFVANPLWSSGTVTYGAVTAGNTLAALIPGVLTGDLTCATIAAGAGGATDWSMIDTDSARRQFRTAGAALTAGRCGVIIPCFGAPFVRLQIVLGTATNVLIVGRRVQGFWAQPRAK